jgi:hypothetical protein
VNKGYRDIAARLLTVIYTFVVLGPLAPFALKSTQVRHLVTGVCAGDCEIDGCSLASRANHTCCCWQKKLNRPPEEATRDCCQPKEHQKVAQLHSCDHNDKNGPVYKCGDPCGRERHDLSGGFVNVEILPFLYVDEIVNSWSNILTVGTTTIPVSRLGEPPDPPPHKILQLS